MFGLPTIADYLLNIDPIQDVTMLRILEQIELLYLNSIPYTYAVGLSAQTASVYLTVVVTIERLVNEITYILARPNFIV